MAVVSALILWPFFGLTRTGLMLFAMLTVVVVLHEAGHMFAFRAMGHKSARMIIIPFLGGVALGGALQQPFVGFFCGACWKRFWRFPVIAAISLYGPIHNAGYPVLAAFIGAFGTIGAIFNLGNLVPVWKFDGGQVIRQVFRKLCVAQGVASFILLAGLLTVGKMGGFSNQALMVAGAWSSIPSIATPETRRQASACAEPDVTRRAGVGLLRAVCRVFSACGRGGVGLHVLSLTETGPKTSSNAWYSAKSASSIVTGRPRSTRCWLPRAPQFRTAQCQ